MHCDVPAAQLVGRQCPRREGFAAKKRIRHDRSVLTYPDISALHLRDWNLAVENRNHDSRLVPLAHPPQKGPISVAKRPGARLTG